MPSNGPREPSPAVVPAPSAAGAPWAGAFPLALITFVFNLGGGLIAPTLPLYARELGADYRDLGLIGASHGLAFAALTIPLGRASDHVGRRTILLVSALAIGGAAGIYLLADGVLGLAAGKLLEAAGWAAFWPALEAWVAERFAGRAGAVMGVAYGAYAAAFVVGTSAAGFVIEAAGFRAPFALYLATAALSAVLVLGLVHPGRAGPHAHALAVTPRIVAVNPGRAREQRVLAYLTGFVYVFGLGTVLSFLPVHAADRGLSPGGVGLVLGGYWLARLMGSLAAGRLSDRLSRRLVLVPALFLTGVAAAAVAAASGIPLLAAGTVGLGLAAGACAPTCVGLIADHVAAADRGMAMGLFEAACGVSMLLAGAAGGFAAQAWGGGAPYILVGAVGLAWMLVLGRRLRA